MRAALRAARFWFQLIVTAGFIALLVWRIGDVGDALRALADANWAWVLPGLVIYTASKAVHTLRWRIFLGADRNVPYAGLLGIFLVSNMANAVLLLRAGDLLRIQTTSQRYGISRSEVTATVVVVETLLDGVAFVALIAIAFSFGAIPGVLEVTFWTMAGLAVFGLALGVAVARFIDAERLERLLPLRWLSTDALHSVKHIVGQFIEGMRTLRESRLAVPAIGLSLVAWMMEGITFWFFGQAFGLALDLPMYLLIMITANFAVSIPLTPSGIGPYEVATQELVVLLGVGRAAAAGFAIGSHLCLILWVTLTGLVAMWMMHLSVSDVFYLSQDEPDARTQPEPS